MADSLLIKNLPIAKQIEATAHKNLEMRIKNSVNYSNQEIKDIEEKSTSLFPKDFSIPKDICNRLRALCSLSQTNIKDCETVKSHRKYVGPIIVFVKKLVLKLLQAQLHNTFKGIEQFNAWSTEAYAKEAYARHQLEKKLNN